MGRKRKPLLARALRRLHGDVAHAWSVEELAREAGLSRSVFSERFGQKVGVHPMQYLIEWRIALAKDMLQRDARPLSARHDAGLLTRFISLVRRHRQGFVRPQRDSTMSTVILAIISLLVSNCRPVSAPYRSCGWNNPDCLAIRRASDARCCRHRRVPVGVHRLAPWPFRPHGGPRPPELAIH